MTEQTIDDMRVPRPALFAAAAIMLFSILAAYAGRAGYIDRVSVAQAAPLETRLLSFETLSDKSVAVFDVEANKSLGIREGGDAGFINGVLRGLNHDRRIQGIAFTAPYQLIHTSANRFALADPQTGRRVELLGFGADNDASFARLMSLGRTK